MKPLIPLAILLLVIFLNFTACTPPNPITSPSPSCTIIQSSTSSYEVNIEASTPPALTATYENTPIPEEISLTEQTTYQFYISLNYQEHRFSVSEIIDYTNSTGNAISYLPLVVPPAYSEGVFHLDSVQMESAYEDSTTYLEKGILHFQLDPALEAGERLELSLIFHLTPPYGNSTLGYTERQLLLADWYPFVPPHLDSRGWLVNPPGAVGEYLSYPRSDFSVNLLISPPDESIVIAASAPLESHEGNCYRYLASNVRNFSLALSSEYQVSTLENDLAAVWVYTFPEHLDKGVRAAALALSAWNTFTSLYGDNQRQFLSIVEADIATADETPKNYYETLIVHETSHQWFYGLVQNDQANEPWLDEVLATYSELLYIESHHPELVDWWWDFRVHSYSPTGYVNSTIYDYDEYRPYINAVYLNGVTFLNEIRLGMGDEDFKTFLHAYAQAGQDYSNAVFFFSLLTDFSSADIAPLIAAYFK